MTVFVLSFSKPGSAASVNMIGFIEGFSTLTCAEYCSPCVVRTVITGAETDACGYTNGTLMDGANFSASSVLSIHPEIFVRSSSGVPTGELLRKLDPQTLVSFAHFISFSAILVLRVYSSCKPAISISFASRLSFSRRVRSSSCF